MGNSNGPEQADVDAVRDLLDLMADFSSNDQRARYLLTSNWMRDRGAAAARAAQEVWQAVETSAEPAPTDPSLRDISRPTDGNTL